MRKNTAMTKVAPTPGIVEAAHEAFMTEPRTRGVDNFPHLVEVAVTAAFNHPETSALFNVGKDSETVWTPLYRNDPLECGNRVRRVVVDNGISYIEEGVVGFIDKDGDVWASGDYHLGTLGIDTMYVLRGLAQTVPAHPDLPSRDGAVIVKKSDKIQARHDGKTWATSEAVLVCGEWRGTWLEEGCNSSQRGVMWAMSPDRIIPDTWKVDEK